MKAEVDAQKAEADREIKQRRAEISRAAKQIGRAADSRTVIRRPTAARLETARSRPEQQ